MLYDIRHTTTYRYAAGVGSARCLLHLSRATARHQTVLARAIAVEPRPTEMRAASISSATSMTTALSTGCTGMLVDPRRLARRVSTAACRPPERRRWWRWSRRAALAPARPRRRPPRAHVFPAATPRCCAAITDYAAASFAPGRPVLAAAQELMRRIHADFAYDPEATDVSTPSPRVVRRSAAASARTSRT